MAFQDNKTCCGCLCADRETKLLSEYGMKQCFSQILCEEPMQVVNCVPPWLCWQCYANIKRFLIFKKQVKECYKMFSFYSKQNLNLSQIHKPSTIRIQKQYNIKWLPEDTIQDEVIVEDVKIENLQEPSREALPTIKDETDFPSDHYSEEDDKALIEISMKKKKKLNGNRKKKKKEVIEIYRELELTEDEIREERRLLEMREDYVNAMFRCERCIISFPNQDDFIDHVKIKHELNASHHKCNICECSFSSEVSYNYHRNKHVRRYQCTVCMQLGNSKRNATRHYETVHCHSLQPELNPEDFSIKNTEHKEENAVKSELYPCDQCEKKFKWKTSLRKHLETHRIESGHKRRPYCEPCRLSFTTTSNLQKHVKTSSKHQLQLKLRKLKEANASPQAIERALSLAASVGGHACRQCGRKFQWRGNLLRHVHSHHARANGELQCVPCNRTFSSLATLQQHMRISKKHVSEDDYKYMCSDCGKKFANKTRLKDHIDWDHLKNYVHTCPVCQKVFKSHTSLYLHKQAVHGKDTAAHLCDHCGKAFPNHAKLRSHARALHSREAAFCCAACPAQFAWHSCLSRHVRRSHAPPADTQA